jgi:hypothetical protein
MLQQQQQNRQAAGVGGKPVSMPIQNFQPPIPTLTSAQFAALVGAQEEATSADPQTTPAAQVPPVSAQQAAAAATLRLSGAATRSTTLAAPANAKPADSKPAEESEDAPSIFRASAAQQVAAAEPSTEADAAPEITRKGEQMAAAVAAPETGEKTPAESETAAKSDPDVVHLKSPPDKDQQTELRMRHKRWVVDETPGARQLFFGADGVFGWDDFLDLINPLQHIPGVAQIYRAVTGDEINGAASLLGAIPYGPFSGLGIIATVADLAIKDTTGKDMGENLVAMVFGDDKKPSGAGTTAPADMAEAEQNGAVPVQTASRESRYALSEASQMHEACRG